MLVKRVSSASMLFPLCGDYLHAVIAVAASSRTVTLQSSDPLPHSHGLGFCTLNRVAARQLEKKQNGKNSTAVN